MATVKELRKQAKKVGVTGYSNMQKGELEKAIAAAPKSGARSVSAPSSVSEPESLLAGTTGTSLGVKDVRRQETEYVQPATARNGMSDNSVSNQETHNTWTPFEAPDPGDSYGEADGDTRDSAGERSAGITDRRMDIVGS